MLGLLMVIYVGSSVVKFVLGLDQSYCIDIMVKVVHIHMLIFHVIILTIVSLNIA